MLFEKVVGGFDRIFARPTINGDQLLPIIGDDKIELRHIMTRDREDFPGNAFSDVFDTIAEAVRRSAIDRGKENLLVKILKSGPPEVLLRLRLVTSLIVEPRQIVIDFTQEYIQHLPYIYALGDDLLTPLEICQ